MENGNICENRIEKKRARKKSVNEWIIFMVTKERISLSAILKATPTTRFIFQDLRIKGDHKSQMDECNHPQLRLWKARKGFNGSIFPIYCTNNFLVKRLSIVNGCSLRSEKFQFKELKRNFHRLKTCKHYRWLHQNESWCLEMSQVPAIYSRLVIGTLENIF